MAGWLVGGGGEQGSLLHVGLLITVVITLGTTTTSGTPIANLIQGITGPHRALQENTGQ